MQLCSFSATLSSQKKTMTLCFHLLWTGGALTLTHLCRSVKTKTTRRCQNTDPNSNLHPQVELPPGKLRPQRQDGCPLTTPIKVTAGPVAGPSGGEVEQPGGGTGGFEIRVRETLPAWCVWWILRRGCCRCSGPAWCHRTARTRRLRVAERTRLALRNVRVSKYCPRFVQCSCYRL